MESPKMYLFVFKKPNEIQMQAIRNTFLDYDWDAGFAVEDVIANDILHKNLIIQFASFKEFSFEPKDSNEITLYPITIESVLTGKGQFLGHLLSLCLKIENLDTYFCYLGEASEERNTENEVFYKVEYDKYSTLHKVDISLEILLGE